MLTSIDIRAAPSERGYHAQFGEDAIVDAILEAAPALPGRPEGPPWVVEFGAWDGKHFSNTRRLIETQNARGVLIEASDSRFADLKRQCERFENLTPVCAKVGWEGPDRLDAILAKTQCPEIFDVLSIDIDGNDYHVWEATERYRAAIVVIEHNPTIPPHLPYVQPRDPDLHRGASLVSLVELGFSKDYRLAAITEVNAIFVDYRVFPSLGIADNSIEALRDPEAAAPTWLCHGIDGRCFLMGSKSLHWHDVPMTDRRAQQLPGWLHGHRDTLGSWSHAALRFLGRHRGADAKQETHG
ncbi:MAG: hypothetical protein AAGB34_07165 [Planctomycetota bacterium]